MWVTYTTYYIYHNLCKNHMSEYKERLKIYASDLVLNKDLWRTTESVRFLNHQRCFFHNHWKVNEKIFSTFFVQKPWKKMLCSCLWTYYFCAENRERLLLNIFFTLMICAKTENVQLVFFYIEDCMAAFKNIWMFFNERAATS